MHSNSIFAVRTDHGTSYFNNWNDAMEYSLFEIGCIDEVYLDDTSEPVYEYKIGDPDFSMGAVQ